MTTSFRKALVGAALLGATAAGGALAATALVDDGTTPTTTPVSSDTATDTATATDTGSTDTGVAEDDAATDDDTPAGPHAANGITEEPLTGDNLTKATAAAQAAVPDGTVDRAETDADGATYEVHMTKADGSHVTVKLNADFTVAEIETNEGHGGRGHGRGHGGSGKGEEALTGDALTQATAAAQAAVPDGTIDRAETDADGATYEVHMTKADGSHVTVKLNADFTVAEIETGGR